VPAIKELLTTGAIASRCVTIMKI